jgi:hypothetical protein
MCLSEGGQYAQNLLTILGSIVNIIWFFHFAQDIHMSSEITRKFFNGFANYLALIMYFISWEKWVQS